MHPELNIIPPIALTIRQPWAWLVAAGYKPVENRVWRTHYRGRFAIHSASTCTRKEYQNAVKFSIVAEYHTGRNITDFPAHSDLTLGAIIGEATLVDCIPDLTTPWSTGPWCWIIEQPILYPKPISCPGRLGFFRHGCQLEKP